MIMMLVPVAAVAQAAPPSPPAPPLLTTTAVPPAPQFSGYPQEGARVRERFQVDVTVRGPDVILWQGTLWVGGIAPSYARQSQGEPGDPACPVSGSNRYRIERSKEFSIELTSFDRTSADAPRTSVAVRWVRPAGQGCAELGTRAVELRQSVLLQPGQSVTLQGDGGLNVQLRRR